MALSGLVGLHVRPFIGCAVDALLSGADLASCGVDAVASAPAGVALAGAFQGHVRSGATSAGSSSAASSGWGPELVAAVEPTPVSVRPALCALAAEARATTSRPRGAATLLGSR